MADFDYLTALPGEDRERRWIRERLETLSVRESFALAAAAQRTQPEDMAMAISCLQSLSGYTVRTGAGSYAALGEAELHRKTILPDSAMPFVDLTALGEQYEDQHPGLFVGNCYVEYPEKEPLPTYQRGGSLPEDNGWSVKLKLASPAVPEGVWLRLPGQFDGDCDCTVDEILTLQELHVQRWDECELLDARCILPQIGNLMVQYSEIPDLLYDGIELGFVLDQKGQGMPHFAGRYAAALELERSEERRVGKECM